MHIKLIIITTVILNKIIKSPNGYKLMLSFVLFHVFTLCCPHKTEPFPINKGAFSIYERGGGMGKNLKNSIFFSDPPENNKNFFRLFSLTICIIRGIQYI